ncbi:16S rRNA (guanine(527)-N(7))-methyltransferase RsmG [Coxiella endosymbiont of Amblyomma nuttalli]|uniref:16S rRNA (guanine(527)-N(7))-methyltransferase RsmG n=1 Tax=Coxiella endosymbiont of Amblyomma nuttalli TaxID=2749996 RepID=UPI001BAD38BB|nr:16S rRNA (guanine(527)-N(7))-methyltransferase RsmG [Coxiella endosymbiont of Amblyomma nuttalli]
MKEKLKKGIAELKLAIPETTQQTLLDFLIFLQKWNQAYNLTAITDVGNMITYHLLDSLSIIPYFKGKTILDVGSGAGFPGIPLALAYPNKQFTLLDSKNKRSAFLLQAIHRFKISNVAVVQARVPGYRAALSFDAITCRAFGSLRLIVDQTQYLLCPLGRWFIMKGSYPKEELQIIAQPFFVHRLTVPGLNAERHLVEIENKYNCNR